MIFRQFENRVIDFFIDKIPEITKYVENTYEYCNEDDNIGMYILMPDILKYFEDCIKNRDKKKTRLFLERLDEFRYEFKNDYEKLQKESIENFIAVVFYEDCIDCLNKEDLYFVYELFNSRFKNEFHEYKIICDNQLLVYLEDLLKNEKVKLDIKYVDKNNYNFINKLEQQDELKIIKVISLTNKTFYVVDEENFCYFGVLKENYIQLIYRDTYPMSMFKTIKLTDYN